MQRRELQSGFTLIELMISIALVVILMLGITKVFTLTSQTASATNQMSSSIRDARAAHSELSSDFSHAVTNGPFMIIHSITQPAFRNKADADSDRDGIKTTIDLDSNNIEGEPGVAGEKVQITDINSRNHRLDTISFFARHRFSRQTGGSQTGGTANGPLIAPFSSTEAWIWYGHLWLPNNNGVWPAPTNLLTPSVTFPGQDTLANNPNNYYATQWILGRVAVLLAQPDATGQIFDRSSPAKAQQFFVQDPSAAYFMSPFQAGSYDNASVPASKGPNATTLEQARYDLAGTTIDGFRNYLFSSITANPAARWFDPVMSREVATSAAGGFTGGRFQASRTFAPPLDAKKFATQAPIFLPGCTQFIVEYAGDFLNQEPVYQYFTPTAPIVPTAMNNPKAVTKVNQYAGQIINTCFQPVSVSPTTVPPPETDGKIDFVVTTDPVTGAKAQSIRWYGLPRDVDGDGHVYGPASNKDLASLPDVVPLRDIISSIALTNSPIMMSDAKYANLKSNAANILPTFERYDPAAPSGDYATDSSITPSTFEYTCGWGPTDVKPKMIRIIMTIDDPDGKLSDGQTYEYIFTLP